MPTHGYGPFRRFLLGSVTAKVLHDAICPVWTGPHMESAPDYSTVRFQNIVCVIDLGLHSREVLCWAGGFAREFGARLSIVHAIPSSATRLGGFYFDPYELYRRQILTHPALLVIGDMGSGKSSLVKTYLRRSRASAVCCAAGRLISQAGTSCLPLQRPILSRTGS